MKLNLTRIWKLERFLRYCAISAMSAVITFGSAFLLHEALDAPEWLAGAIAYAFALAFNFFAIRYFVFQSNASKKKQVIRFALASVAFRAAEYVVYLTLIGFGMWYITALVTVAIISQFMKFYVQREFVFN